jgi:hypothetical protein
MNESDLNAKNIVERLIEVFPELRARFLEETRTFDRAQAHLIYSFVFYRFIEDMFKAGKEDEAMLRRLFDFAELLVDHQDMYVDDVAHHAICTKIANNELVLQKSQKYMGPKMKKACAGIVGNSNQGK